jgi:hypothetical protein
VSALEGRRAKLCSVLNPRHTTSSTFQAGKAVEFWLVLHAIMQQKGNHAKEKASHQWGIIRIRRVNQAGVKRATLYFMTLPSANS